MSFDDQVQVPAAEANQNTRDFKSTPWPESISAGIVVVRLARR